MFLLEDAIDFCHLSCFQPVGWRDAACSEVLFHQVCNILYQADGSVKYLALFQLKMYRNSKKHFEVVSLVDLIIMATTGQFCIPHRWVGLHWYTRQPFVCVFLQIKPRVVTSNYIFMHTRCYIYPTLLLLAIYSTLGHGEVCTLSQAV